jgi:hypothetical protein
MNLIKNPKIKEVLKNRWNELDIKKMSLVVQDAEERAPEMKITSARISKWLSGYKHDGKSVGLTENQIVWLLVRWGIPVSLTIGEPSLLDGRLKYSIPDYNELEALKMLKVVFPKKEKDGEK